MSITPIPAQPVYPSSSSYHTSVPLPPQSQQSVPDLSNDLSSLAISGATSHASYTTQVQPSGHTIPSSNAGISTSKSQQRQQPKSSTHGSVPRGKMHIFFETLSKEKIMVAVESSNTVHEVKAMIMTEKGIPIHQQRLVYQGRQLDDGYTLADYNIQNESVVYLVLRI
ncbi:hypothetical protein RIF29_21296 [Crotalaria pallida]|uniref:Ubiquitin-like domain-containing protein n=1 Tax=Crotalaria pallida TaxID=3830 RepID=A0AAN9F524_CROPI